MVRDWFLFLKTVLFFFFIFMFSNLYAEPERFIEVKGSAEMEIVPDELNLVIQIEEYWLEEFLKETEFKDYQTKVKIDEIEQVLIADLMRIGIEKEFIKVTEVGNFWRFKGKEFLFQKELNVTIHDFSMIDAILKVVNTRGISYMRIGKLKHKDLTQFRQEVKIEALKAAKRKADYLLNSIQRKTGDVISIIEIEDNNNWNFPASMSNSVMDIPGERVKEFGRKIFLRSEILVKYEIQ